MDTKMSTRKKRFASLEMKRKDGYGCKKKPRLYHAYNERQFGIHKILKAKQL